MRTREDKIFQLIGHTVMIILSLLAVLPMILLLMSSITDDGALIRDGYSFFPKEFSLYAYEYVFKTGNMVLHAYGMSVILTATGVVLALVVTTMFAYTLSVRTLPGRGVLLFYVLLTMLFNGGLVPTYINYTNVFNIKNTFFAILIPGLVTNGFYIMLMKSYFASSIPEEIMEAAKLDGAGEWQTFLLVALPLAKPIVATIGLFAGIAYWNDWMNGYIYLTKATNLYTIQNLLNRMIQNMQFLTQNSSNLHNADVGLSAIPTVSIRMAMAILGILPIVVVYPFIQKNFIKGITLGGVKG